VPIVFQVDERQSQVWSAGVFLSLVPQSKPHPSTPLPDMQMFPAGCVEAVCRRPISERVRSGVLQFALSACCVPHHPPQSTHTTIRKPSHCASHCVAHNPAESHRQL